LMLVDKPEGLTSHDVVDRIRKHFSFRKVGHGGTLDPMATGLLVLLIGRGTKLSDQVMGADKGYEGVMHFGISTDSHDRDGEVTEERDAGGLTRDQLEAEMDNWRGDVMQTPPMVSAIKKNGVPLYKLARKGKSIEREPRLIHIFDLKLLDVNLPEAAFRMKCTKGTYVRTLAADIGEALGCGAHLSALRRTASGKLSVDDAVPLDTILDWDRDQFGERLIPATRFLAQVKADS
ncbi:MAG: tRNA pseudouridine(55) synthase TruB, partial [Verrucomicrobiota bacterium]